jgi:hypothetical protein
MTDRGEQGMPDEEPVWVCVECCWEGHPDKVATKCPGCGRDIGDDEP